MDKYGVVISQQGLDISRAADYQKVLDSRWKFMDILEEIDIDITYNLSGATINSYHLIPVYTHSLGYCPAFEFFPGKKQVVDYRGTKSDTYPTRHDLLKADDNTVYYEVYYNSNVPESVSGRVVGKLRVFAVNILEEYTAPAIYEFSTTAQPPSKYGAKFLDLHKGIGNIDDENMESFTLNTRGKQISIHKHGIAQADGNLTITHDVGYPPTYLLAKAFDPSEYARGSYFQPPWPYKTNLAVGGLVSSYYLAEVTPSTITFRFIQSVLHGKYGYIILKDPAELAG